MPTLLQRPGWTGSLLRFWQSSYASDYLGVVVVLVFDGLIQTFVEPFHRMFRIDTQTLHFPFAQIERVSVGWLFIFGLGVPVLVLFVWAATFRPSIHKIHVTYLGLLTSVLLTVFITDVVKNAVGRPRPDLIERCNPHRDTPRNVLVTYAVCDQPDVHKLHDGWRSFPSGHSSFAFSGLGYLALFFAAQFHVLHPATSLPTMLLTLSPLLGALLIAISRCEDYRHDVYDVTTGSLLGLLIAWLTYRRYYPSLRSSRCETPWASRGEIMMAAAKWHAKKASKDEEATIGFRNGEALNGSGSKSGSGGIGASGDESDGEVDKGLLRGTSTPR